jgi:biotin carboxylase
MISKTFLVLAGGHYQLPLIRSLKMRGIHVTLFDGDKEAPGFLESDDGLVIDISDPLLVLEAAKNLNIIGIASIVNEASVVSAAISSRFFKLPTISIETAHKCTNKFLMRESFLNSKMQSPTFFQADSIYEVRGALNKLGLPAIIKPIDSSGSRGVMRIDNFSSLESIAESAIKESKKGSVIIESFLDGPEFTVETFTENGETVILGFSQKKRVDFPACVSIELQYFPYKQHPYGYQIISTALEAIKSVGLNRGPAHIEVIFTPKGPVVVEIAARGGGFRIFPDILKEISGVDVIDLVIDQSLGIQCVVKPIIEKSAVLRFFNPEARGIISAVSGLEIARKLPYIKEVVLERDVIGSNYEGIKKDGDRLGYILTVAEHISDAIKAADLAEKTINFDIREVSY